jgi:lysophospholipase L1-like esterase
MRNSLKIILANLGGVLLVIALLDAVMYHLLPVSYTKDFREYRRAPAPDVPGRSEYPQYYFVEHPTRGFDIGLNQQGAHWVEGVEYPIWSNSQGCFDGEHSQDSDYVYFAGDSFTWGYAPFEQKFGTLVEKQSAMDIFKCGVTHTGQRHQFEKFRDIVEQHGNAPKAVFVFYSANDLANDYAHPHTAVKRGWQIDSAGLDANNNIVRFTDAELNQKFEQGLAKLERKRRRWWQSAAKPLLRYSLTANILNGISEKTKDAFEENQQQNAPVTEPLQQPTVATADTSLAEKVPAANVSPPAVEPAAVAGATPTPQQRQAARSLYLLPAGDHNSYDFLNNPYSLPNKQALLNFKTYSLQHGIKYVVVLIPGKWNPNDTQWYRELHSFLHDNDIDYLDLATAFAERNLGTEDLYWVHDGHFSPAGNKQVADILIERYPQIFQQN